MPAATVKFYIDLTMGRSGQNMPKYAPPISYLAYLGADFFVDFSNISSRLVKRKQDNKQIRPTYCVPFCDDE